MMAHNKPKLVS